MQRFPIFGQAHNLACESDDVFHIRGGDVLTHTSTSSVDDALRNILVIVNHPCQVMQAVGRKSLFVFDKYGNLGIFMVLGHDLDELGKVPRIPLPDSHGECIDGFVEVIQNCDGLYDVVVILLHRKLDLCS